MRAVMGSFAICLLAYACHPAAGHAAPLAPELEAQLDPVTQYNYRGGSTYETPPLCSTTCSQLWSSEHRPTSPTTASTDLNRESTKLRIRTGLLRSLRGIGTLTLFQAAGQLGLKLGEGIRAKYTTIDVPEIATGGTGQQVLAPWEKGWDFTIGEFAPDPITITMPDDGFLWRWYSSGGWRNETHTDPDPGCNGGNGGPPSSLRILSTGPYSRCSILNELGQTVPGASGVAIGGYALQWDLLSSPLVDYESQPVDRSLLGTFDPGYSLTKTRTRTEMESGDYPTLTRKLEFELGVPDACDPMEPAVCNPPNPPSQRERQRRCDLEDGGAGEDPDPARTKTINHPDLYVLHAPLTRREIGSDPSDLLVPTALKKGWTESHAVREWAGWGWRHIHAKHGWTVSDAAATQLALQNLPIRQLNGALRYVGHEYDQNGETCARWVIVRDEPRVGEPEPAEIVTSYGAVVE